MRVGHSENRPMTKDLIVFLELIICNKKKLPTEAIQKLLKRTQIHDYICLRISGPFTTVKGYSTSNI